MKKALILSLVSIFIPSLALAIDMPAIKPGLWEVSITIDGNKQDKMKQCVDENTAEKLLTAGQKMLQGSCSDVAMKKEGAKYVSSIECNLGVTKMVATTQLSGDFNKHYVSQTTTTFNPPMMGKGSSTSTSDGRWVGPCKDGMRPGDTVLPDGRKMNVLEMLNKRPQN